MTASGSNRDSDIRSSMDMNDAASLVEHARSCLVVIDVQQYFLDKLPASWSCSLVERIAWLMQVANLLGIPVIATAEDVQRNGPLLPDLERLIPAGAPGVFDKMVFNLWGQHDIRQAVKATGRDTMVLAGLETDVCVAQSALGLHMAGYRVAVVTDACGSPAPNHDHGLRRLDGTEIMQTTVKMLFYEWVRDLEGMHRVRSCLDSPWWPG